MLLPSRAGSAVPAQERRQCGRATEEIGPEVLELSAAAEAVDDQVRTTRLGRWLAGDALNVTIDPVKASLEGMTTQDISSQVNDYLTGNVATQLAQPLKTIGVRVSLHPSLRRRDL